MIILANSFGVCHILLVFVFSLFFFLFSFFLKSGLGPSPVVGNTQSTPSRCAGTLIGAAVIFHRKSSPKSGKDPI